MSGDWRDVRIYAEKPYSISFESSAFRHLISDLGANAEMSDRFENWKFPEIEEGKPTKYNWVVQHKENFRLGYQTDIGAFTYINAKFGVTIEDEVQIGSHCSIYSVSTIDDKVGEVVLKKNCRVGTHSTIMPRVTVGENAVVGAHSFVNEDVPDGITVVGVPARSLAQSRQDAKTS